MRVLYLNSGLTRPDSEAGVWGCQLVRELRATGTEVMPHPIVPPAAAAERPPDGWRRRAKKRLQRRLPLSWSLALIDRYLLLRGFARTVATTWRLWRSCRGEPPDVILARTYEYEWTPWLVSRLLGCPLVLEVHAPFFVERKLRGGGHSGLLRWFEQRQWRAAARLFVISPELASIIGPHLTDTRRIQVIPHGINLDRFAPRHPAEAGGRVRIVFVGSFYHWHGLDALLEAFARVRECVSDVTLLLIGDGIMRGACEARARELGVVEAVEFTGWLPHDRVVEGLRGADIAVAPYLKLEPFYFEPVKILEYMAVGLAVVASDQERIVDLLDGGKLGVLVPAGDVPALAEALIALARDGPRREALGQAARARIASHHRWEVTADRVRALCAEAIAENGLGRAEPLPGPRLP